MTLTDRIYKLLDDKDLSSSEIAKELGVRVGIAESAIMSATINYPDIYEYDVMRNGRKVAIVGRLCNYRGQE